MKSALCKSSCLTSKAQFIGVRPFRATWQRCRVLAPLNDSKLVEKITGEQLEKEIADRDRTLIVDFFATWCGPCLLLASELEKVAESLGDKVKVLKIDVDENPELSSQLKIEGLPTIVFIPKESGKPALRTEGLLPAQQIMDIVAEL
ncbi:hypothetical protein CEUSTIGMA_g4837.t1 [Chlamydomonas eustigma]|uniref:Thioredoxin domain-containing protein n=1 Tax=Chlamydomonas eustigma TaxID=1157962 RepID=A0A250X2U9_9CHLO|nr:hypothetical protein CEUSTIGMA_g4837.t1 [Chlamydomonas eustigma]|eukprot:GAX77391.1 hypothetical protein CEUSTIGMA_g4837.t1 [Chlamydomonas eustigma]